MKPRVFYYGYQALDLSDCPERSAEERVGFVSRHLPSFTKLNDHPNDKGYSVGMFTGLTQHLKGNSVEELIDAGLFCEENGFRGKAHQASLEHMRELGL